MVRLRAVPVRRRLDDDAAGATPLECSLSLVTPVFNREALIVRTLRSFERILPEHRDRVQLVLIDDGSTDRSLKTMESYAANGPFQHVEILRENHGGVSVARNAGLHAARGRWLMMIDSDDELAFDPLPHLERCTDATALLFSVDYHRDDRAIGTYRVRGISREGHLDFFTAGCPLPNCGIAFRRDQVRVPFEADDDLLEDWSFWIDNPGVFRVSECFPEVVSAIVHIHDDNRTRRVAERGERRVVIARRTRQRLGAALTERQRNNLKVQEAIGRLQNARRRRLKDLFLLPCTPALYARLLAHWILGASVERFKRYG